MCALPEPKNTYTADPIRKGGIAVFVWKMAYVPICISVSVKSLSTGGFVDPKDGASVKSFSVKPDTVAIVSSIITSTR